MQKVLQNIKTAIIENKLYALKVLVVVVLVVVGIFTLLGDSEGDHVEVSQSNQDIEEDLESVDSGTSTVIVDVSGEVKTPMVVELPMNSRIDDAVNAAGGLTDKADVNQINRAQILEDGQKIYIPPRGLVGKVESKTAEGNSFASETDKININLADLTELQEIPGVGPATAQKIDDYRKDNGGFKKIEDIKNVNGIGDKTFEKMKDRICV